MKKFLKIGVVVKKVICAECEKAFMLHPEALKDFECDECGCDDYKDWGYKSEKKTTNHPQNNPPTQPKSPEPKTHAAAIMPFLEKKEEIIKPEIKHESQKEIPKLEKIIEEIEQPEEEYDEEEVADETDEEICRKDLIEEFAPYIKNKGLKEITIKYDFEGVDVFIALKNGELND
jgi:hypothetical protein